MDEATLHTLITAAIAKANEGHRTREMALVVTKLEEAMMWNTAHNRALEALARRTIQQPPLP